MTKQDLKTMLNMLPGCLFVFTCDIGSLLAGDHMNALELLRFAQSRGSITAQVYVYLTIFVSIISTVCLLGYVILCLVDHRLVNRIRSNNEKITWRFYR